MAPVSDVGSGLQVQPAPEKLMLADASVSDEVVALEPGRLVPTPVATAAAPAASPAPIAPVIAVPRNPAAAADGLPGPAEGVAGVGDCTAQRGDIRCLVHAAGDYAGRGSGTEPLAQALCGQPFSLRSGTSRTGAARFAGPENDAQPALLPTTYLVAATSAGYGRIGGPAGRITWAWYAEPHRFPRSLEFHQVVQLHGVIKGRPDSLGAAFSFAGEPSCFLNVSKPAPVFRYGTEEPSRNVSNPRRGNSCPATIWPFWYRLHK